MALGLYPTQLHQTTIRLAGRVRSEETNNKQLEPMKIIKSINITILTITTALAVQVQAQVSTPILAGFTDYSLPREDDFPSQLATMPFTINFYGTWFSDVWVNNNGNVTFDGSLSQYTPGPLNSAGTSIIAPYWADVDTRNPASGVVTYGNGTVDNHAAFGVDWVNVGYYNSHADLLLSCQLVIIDRSDIAPGDFDMEFNYDKVQWEWGDVSVGAPPHAGFSDGGANDVELPGSGVEGAFLDINTVTGLIYNSLNSTVPGQYIFYFRDGTPLESVPEPNLMAIFCFGAAGLAFLRWRQA
jgi:hypothetical protein